MWAIIERTMIDAEAFVNRIYARRVSLYADNGHSRYDNTMRNLGELKSHIRHWWFGEICNHAGIHRDWILKHIKKLEERAAERYGRK